MAYEIASQAAAKVAASAVKKVAATVAANIPEVAKTTTTSVAANIPEVAQTAAAAAADTLRDPTALSAALATAQEALSTFGSAAINAVPTVYESVRSQANSTTGAVGATFLGGAAAVLTGGAELAAAVAVGYAGYKAVTSLYNCCKKSKPNKPAPNKLAVEAAGVANGNKPNGIDATAGNKDDAPQANAAPGLRQRVSKLAAQTAVAVLPAAVVPTAVSKAANADLSEATAEDLPKRKPSKKA